MKTTISTDFNNEILSIIRKERDRHIQNANNAIDQGYPDHAIVEIHKKIAIDELLSRLELNN